MSLGPSHAVNSSAIRHAPRLVVIAGLPGAGKTTLLCRLSRSSAVRALDSEDVARLLVGLPVPYTVLRPFVHAAHLARLLWAMRARGCVLTTDPLTSPVRRRLLQTAARVSGRRLVVVLVHATAAQARDGQRRRGRLLGERRMRRHQQRYQRGEDGAADVILSRHAAASVGTLAEIVDDVGAACGPAA